MVTYKSHSAIYEELVRRADMLSLYDRRLQDITILMYKVKHGLVPDCVSELFVRKGSSHLLQNSDFVLPRFELYVMASTLLDIPGCSSGQNLLKIKGICQVYVSL